MKNKTNIIGLGKLGIDIANSFKQYQQYNIFKIGIGDNKNKKCFKLPKFNNPEDYEKNDLKIDKFLNAIKGNIYFILDGSDVIAASCLVILEKLKQNNISIIYIKPDLDFLNDLYLKQEKIIYNILQEYTRSGLFNSIYLINYDSLDRAFDSITVQDYREKFCEFLSWSIHSFNVFDNADTLKSNFSEENILNCIKTIGFSEHFDDEPIFLFVLDIEKEKRYYYIVNEEKMKSKDNIKIIKEDIKNKKEKNNKFLFSIFPTVEEREYLLVKSSTSIIQK